MIEIKNLFKRYHNHHGSKWVLKDINLTIPKGVSVGLVGQNGAGKSTLLRLIGDMDTPDRGEIVRHCSVSWPIGLSGGFQGGLTGRQNVKFVARVHGGEAMVDKTMKFVEEFAELGDSFDEPVRTYSSGMRSRLAFGLSLAFDFEVYLSDEATAVGDAIFKEKAKSAFRERVGKASLVMVSHSEGILRDLCEAGIWLHQGTAYWFDRIDDALQAYKHFRETKTVLTPEEFSKRKALKGGFGRISVDGRKFIGWARNELDPDTPVEIEFTLNGRFIGKATADKSRKDLDEKYGKPCGFVFHLPQDIVLSDGDQVNAVVVGGEIELPNSPKKYTKK